MKINADFTKFAGTNFDPTKYISSPSFGVNRFMLDRLGDEKARATTIVEYRPNSKFPQHTHIGGEEFLVLRGTFKDQYGVFPAGTYVRNPVNTAHEPWVDDDGCVIFVKLLQMTDPQHDVLKDESLHVNYDGGGGSDVDAKTEKTGFGSVLDMYCNPTSGEHVSMCWIDPDTTFPLQGDDGHSGGEELFIVRGSLELSSTGGDDEDNDDKERVAETYTEWGWLRFPPTTTTTTTATTTATTATTTKPASYKIRSGPAGAQVYRKTGHLTQQALSYEKIRIDPETEEVIS